jgi:GT2 family glycosyltransferase
MYSREVFKKCGYHNECIIQYAHDTDFNNRIKMAFGQDCLRVSNAATCIHHNQTGTRNCFQTTVWEKTVKRDSKFLTDVDYNGNPYVERTFFKKPLWNLDFAIKI